jgi:hypothetical protein
VRDRFGNCAPLIQSEPDKLILVPQTPPKLCDGPNMVRDRFGSCVPLVKGSGNVSTQKPSHFCGQNQVRGRNGRCVPMKTAGTNRRGDTNTGHAKSDTGNQADTVIRNIDVPNNILLNANKRGGATSVPIIKTPSVNNPVLPNIPTFRR